MRTLVLIVISVLGATSFAVAADRPDISGTWKMNSAKSDWGGQPGPSTLTFVIRVEGPDFFVTQSSDGGDLELKFNSEGKTCVNDLGNGKMTSTHRWEGNVMLGELKAEGDGWNLSYKDRMSYSADGKVMTTEREVGGSGFSGKQKIVLERQ